MNIKEKKILILGANAETIPIVRKAQELGIYTIVTDHIVNSPAKKIADEYYDINGKDEEAIIELIKKRDIQGVMIGVADPLVSSYVSICQTLKFPCIISPSSLEFFSDKQKFKHKCSEWGLPIINNYFSTSNFEEIDTSKLRYPVVIKPAISRGGKGVSLCLAEEEVQKSFFLARNYSDNNEVICEEYINSNDVVATFFCIGGKTQLLMVSDRIMQNRDKNCSTVTKSNIFPSKYFNLVKEKYLDKYEKLFQSLKIKNGIINIQMFIKDMEFIPYDSDCILNGEICSNIFNSLIGMDVIAMFIDYALTGNEDCLVYDYNQVFPMHVVASVWISLMPGIVGKIEGKEKIQKRNDIIDSVWRMEQGFEVTEEMYQTEKATFARIWVKAECYDELEKVVNQVRKCVRVLDIEGNNMVC